MQNFSIPKGTLCAKCRGREASGWFGENISGMDVVHGNHGQPWCKQCIVERQLEYAKEQANRIPDLELELNAIKNKT